MDILVRRIYHLLKSGSVLIGIEHFLVMFPSAILIAKLSNSPYGPIVELSTILLVCGIGTLFFSCFGKLPLFLGPSFAYIGFVSYQVSQINDAQSLVEVRSTVLWGYIIAGVYLAEVNPVRQLQKGVEARCFDMSTLPTNGCIPTGDVIKPYNGGVRFINGDTLIARITPCLENGKAAYINVLADGEVAFGSTEYIVFAAKDEMPSSFYYFLIRNNQFVTFALQFMNGSSGRQRVSGEELASFPLSRPSSENLLAFDKVGTMALKQMKEIANEIQLLKQLQEIITATLSSR